MEIERAVDHLREQPLLVVIGPSGTGKSSLVKAGVLPTLQEGVPVGAWAVVDMRPGEAPAARLISKLGGEADAPQPLGDLLRNYQQTLPEGARVLLFVDQFEEVFALTNEEPKNRPRVSSSLPCSMS